MTWRAHFESGLHVDVNVKLVATGYWAMQLLSRLEQEMAPAQCGYYFIMFTLLALSFPTREIGMGSSL